MTIIKSTEDPVKDPAAIALGALHWILSDERRARSFLDLTGLTPEGLRASVGEPATHRAVFEFLAAHEPDLVGAAEHLELAPEQLIAAKEALEQ